MSSAKGAGSEGAPTPGTAPGTHGPADALAAAEAALARLTAAPAESRAPRAFRAASLVATALAVVGLVVHTAFEEDSPKVDETSVILLLFILLVPFASRFKVLEIGGAKAEWKDDAAEGLERHLEVLKAQHTAITKLYAELGALGDHHAGGRVPQPRAADPVPQPRAVNPVPPQGAPVPSGPAAAPQAAPEPPGAGPMTGSNAVRDPRRRILWVDEDPAGNTYEREALAGELDVDVATSTQEAVERLRSADYDGLISDVVRTENQERNLDAGRQLLEAVRAFGRPVPVIFYGSPGAVRHQGDDLVAAGATDAVASHVELLQALRRLNLVA